MYYTGISGEASWDSYPRKIPQKFFRKFFRNKIGNHSGGNHTMDKTKVAPGKSITVRDGNGRFVKGNKEGRKFPKGYAGKPKGARNKKTLLAKEFAEDVLYLNPKTRKRMTYLELCLYIKEKADSSPRILNLLLDHLLGKPVERVQHMEVPTFNFTIREEPKDNAEDAKVVEEERFKLPEGD
jgi:hypothetical protein